MLVVPPQVSLFAVAARVALPRKAVVVFVRAALLLLQPPPLSVVAAAVVVLADLAAIDMAVLAGLIASVVTSAPRRWSDRQREANARGRFEQRPPSPHRRRRRRRRRRRCTAL